MNGLNRGFWAAVITKLKPLTNAVQLKPSTYYIRHNPTKRLFSVAKIEKRDGILAALIQPLDGGSTTEWASDFENYSTEDGRALKKTILK